MNRAIFLDRDGVININTHYVNCIEDFKLLPNVREAIQLFKQAGYKIFVVTNQGGVAKGFMTEDDLQEIHYHMKQLIPEIDDIRYCPYYHSFDRKPNPGMIYDLALEYEIYTSESWMIGDMLSDVAAGHNAGCKTILIVNDIVGSLSTANYKPPNYYADGLLDAAKYILGVEGYII